jgi:hypothetical protein
MLDYVVVNDEFSDAATDPYACLCLYHAMEAKRKALNPVPPRPAHAELNLPIRLADGELVLAKEYSQESEENEMPAEERAPEKSDKLHAQSP